MADPSSNQQDSLIASSSSTSGLNISLHPLPLLSISEHCNRARLSSSGPTKVIGALLGTQVNRDISIVNSFELVLLAPDAMGASARGEDVEMEGAGESSAAGAGGAGEGGESGRYVLDAEFFETRKEQFKAVFPAQEVVGWYTIASGVSEDDFHLHQQFARTVDNPVFLVFDSAPEPTSQDLPVRVFEASLEDSGPDAPAPTRRKFVELEYGVESGEAERIAVDGVSRGGMGEGDEHAVVGHLVTQRNAIRMLYERIAMIAEYIDAVSQKRVAPDHAIVRQISSLVSTLPTIDAPEFRQELATEYEDVQLTTYLANLTKQVSALSSYADRHYAVHPSGSPFEGFGPTVQRGFKGGRRR